MVKTYLKTFGRMFSRHKTRLVSVVLMVLVSIGFCAGIGMATDKLRYALDDVYHNQKASDFIVRAAGDLSEHVDALEELGYDVVKGGIFEFKGNSYSAEQTAEVMGMPINIRFDADMGGTFGTGVNRVYFFDSREDLNLLNVPTVLEEAEKQDEEAFSIAVERETAQLKPHELHERFETSVTMTATLPMLGEQTSTETYKFEVCEVVSSPLHLAVRQDISMQEMEGTDDYEELENIFYVFGAQFKIMDTVPFPANNLYISVPELQKEVLFEGGYEDALEMHKAKIEEIVGEDAAVLTLHENFTFQSFSEFADKIGAIGGVMTVVFLLVTLLVVLSTFIRLVDEERSQIACLVTLGYSPAQILTKYLLFALVGTLIGGVGSYFLAQGLAYVIYINFTWNFTLPPYPTRFSAAFYFIVSAVILVSTLVSTMIAVLRMTRTVPAQLMRPRAPRAGKKVFFERIPVLWNRISFKYKSTLRNVLRFKMRFAMTVVAVMFSTALVLAGLAVLDCCIFQDIGTAAMIGVGVIVLLFAALLNAVVIYTLTNINVSERERELATLMVLGYHDKEVSLYVYREIYITSSIGILLGLPLGSLLCLFIFSLMAFGSVAGISWYVWIAAPLISLFFVFAVTLLLRHKIVKINMNESLKAVE